MSLSKTQAIRTASKHVRLSKEGHNAYSVYHPYNWANPDGPTRCDAPRPFQLAKRRRTETVARLALYLMGLDSEGLQIDSNGSSVADLVDEVLPTCKKREQH